MIVPFCFKEAFPHVPLHRCFLCRDPPLFSGWGHQIPFLLWLAGRLLCPQRSAGILHHGHGRHIIGSRTSYDLEVPMCWSKYSSTSLPDLPRLPPRYGSTTISRTHLNHIINSGGKFCNEHRFFCVWQSSLRRTPALVFCAGNQNQQ